VKNPDHEIRQAVLDIIGQSGRRDHSRSARGSRADRRPRGEKGDHGSDRLSEAADTYGSFAPHESDEQ
jgi:hypothetical protein